MTREDYALAIADTIAALADLERRLAEAMREFREAKQQFESDLRLYCAKIRGEDPQMDLEEQP
jgi:hypothetical protein